MQKIDKKCLFNVVLGVSIVSLITAVVLLFSNFFQIVQSEIPSTYDWPVATLIISGLLIGGAIVLFCLRLTNENRTLKAAGILVDFIAFLLVFIFMLTLISTDTIKITIQTLLLTAEVPFAIMIALVDFHDLKDFVTIDVKPNNQKTEEIKDVETEAEVIETKADDDAKIEETNE